MQLMLTPGLGVSLGFQADIDRRKRTQGVAQNTLWGAPQTVAASHERCGVCMRPSAHTQTCLPHNLRLVESYAASALPRQQGCTFRVALQPLQHARLPTHLTG